MKKLLLLSLMLITACKSSDTPNPTGQDYKQDMRDFVIKLSEYAKAEHTGFLIIPQNGVELVSDNGEENGNPDMPYLNAIDGNGQEDLNYGYDNDNQPTAKEDADYLRSFLDMAHHQQKTILVTDYVWTPSKVDDALQLNTAHGYISFPAPDRELTKIPDYPSPIPGENAQVITKLSQVQNFLYLINPDKFATKADFIKAVTATNYDLLIMDLFFHDGQAFTAQEVEQLRQKANGGKRLLIAYLSIGEAENYRYYWQSGWNTNPPVWMDTENPDWPGNFKVQYWNPDWQAIIYGNDQSYLKKILDAGYDGAYLDIIDAFEYFEGKLTH